MELLVSQSRMELLLIEAKELLLTEAKQKGALSD
jgi:hypothetical protein